MNLVAFMCGWLVWFALVAVFSVGVYLTLYGIKTGQTWLSFLGATIAVSYVCNWLLGGR